MSVILVSVFEIVPNLDISWDYFPRSVTNDWIICDDVYVF